jgi:hypothetical protein
MVVRRNPARVTPELYLGRIAETYQRIDEVLRGGPGSDYCPYADWLRGEKRDYFARLAARALEIATARDETPR